MDISPQLQPYVRLCKNIKSRKNPDIQCPFPASNGDFCGRHSKNPTLHIKTYMGRPTTRTTTAAARAIRKFWIRTAPMNRYRLQGPAANDLSLAVNDTELYSLEPTETIPPMYRFSIYDNNKSIWVFDIRSLAHSLGKGLIQKNPYTRTPMTPTSLDRLYARVAWLRRRRYQIIYAATDVLTPDQIWNQRVLDVFLKMEALGYYVNSEWFHAMSVADHGRFYDRLHSLWRWRLGLTAAEKEKIVPAHATGRNLFYFNSTDYLHKPYRWWQTTTLGIIDAFVTRSTDREYNKLGATYALMALTEVSPRAAAALQWAVDANRGV